MKTITISNGEIVCSGPLSEKDLHTLNFFLFDSDPIFTELFEFNTDAEHIIVSHTDCIPQEYRRAASLIDRLQKKFFTEV